MNTLKGQAVWASVFLSAQRSQGLRFKNPELVGGTQVSVWIFPII
jgi:hypothetical protein